MSKTKKIILISVMISLFFIVNIVSFFGLGSLVADFAFNSDLKVKGEKIQSAVTHDFLEGVDQEFKKESKWFDDIKKEFLQIQTHDGLMQYAIMLENSIVTDKWVILMHGYRGGIGEMSNYAKNYYENGYNVVIPSLRGHGFSEGDYITFGWIDRLDLLLWINEVVKIDSSSNIVLHGLSMGASTVMMATGEDLPQNVKVAVSDCGYSSVYDEFYYLATNYLKIGAEPAITAVNYFVNKRLGFDISNASSTNQLEKSTTPTLFIHGSGDTFVPAYMLDINYNAAKKLVAGETKEKLLVKDAFHGMSAGVDEKLYWDTVWNFVGKFISQ